MPPTDAAPAPEEAACLQKRNPLAYFLKKRNPLVYVGQAAAVVGLFGGVVPPAGRTYYVTVTLYQPRKGDVDVPLADFDTPEFAGSAAS